MKSKQAVVPYGLSSNAPAIVLPDTDLFKSERGTLARNYFDDKVQQLNDEYERLVELANVNKMVYEADYNFVPRVGQTYHLYLIGEKKMLSIISPQEWNHTHVGSFVYTADSIWRNVNE